MRGIAVIAVPPNEFHTKPHFQLSLRSIDESAIPGFCSPLIDQHLAQTLHTWAVVRFCPWCGVELLSFYKKSWSALYDEFELSLSQRTE
jgi:hypothetical protein